MGVGTAYPMRLNQHGKWTMDSGAARKKRLIASILMTPIATREDDPRLGVLNNFLFRTKSSEKLTLSKFLIIEKLESQVQNIKIVDLIPQQVYGDDGTARLVIDVTFVDLDTNQGERVGILLPTPAGSD